MLLKKLKYIIYLREKKQLFSKIIIYMESLYIIYNLSLTVLNAIWSFMTKLTIGLS